MEIRVQGLSVLIDEQDADFLARCTLYIQPVAHGRFYCQGRIAGSRTKFSLHRLIMQAPAGILVDHKDNNGLNNQRSNLRLGTDELNRLNPNNTNAKQTVFPDRKRGGWTVWLKVGGRHQMCGNFPTQLEAVVERDKIIDYLFERYKHPPLFMLLDYLRKQGTAA